MEETTNLNLVYRDIIRRRFALGCLTGLVLIVITTALALGLPATYKSRAVILIEAQEIPQDLVRSLVTSYADQRIQIISQRVLTNSNLRKIIEKYNLYPEMRARDTMESVVEKMRDDIMLQPISADVVDPKQGKAVKATIAFELDYQNRSPQLAQVVANEIVSLFLAENLKQRAETSEETLGFLTSESERLRSNVGELERKLADFKQKNLGRLPELANFNLELMNRTENQISQLETQIQSLQQQRVYLESELLQQKPMSNQLISETGQRILGPGDRLKVAESELVTLTSRYGATHPDVVAKRKEIDSLRAEVGDGGGRAKELAARLQKSQADLAVAQKKYSVDHPDVIRLVREVETLQSQMASEGAKAPLAATNFPPDNPAYIQLQARLQATNTDLASLQAQRLALKTKLADLENRITQAPEVEREYRMLTRDYERVQANYQEVLAKHQQAELASSLESKRQGERFTLIEPPVTPEEPDKPNRLIIGLTGCLLSVAGGIGTGALAEALDSRVYGRAGVTKLVGVPPLALIPKLETAASLRKRRLRTLIIALGVLFVLGLILLAIHLLVSPLDVLYFRAVRVLGVSPQ